MRGDAAALRASGSSLSYLRTPQVTPGLRQSLAVQGEITPQVYRSIALRGHLEGDAPGARAGQLFYSDRIDVAAVRLHLGPDGLRTVQAFEIATRKVDEHPPRAAGAVFIAAHAGIPNPGSNHLAAGRP